MENEIKAGRLVRIHPRVYMPVEQLDDWATRCRAALAYAGEGSALSHLTALRVWRLPHGGRDEIHVVVPAGRRLRASKGIVVHRRVGLCVDDVLVRQGMPVVRLERSIVDSWPLLQRDEQRAPAIAAVSERMTTADRLATAMREVPNLRGRVGLTVLVGRLAAGCRSELELWGYERVFMGIPGLTWQVPLRLGNRNIYRDLWAQREQVNGELDGAKWHGSVAQRERDARRDSALAAMGIHVVRFTHDRLIAEPDEVRREFVAILATRRRQMVLLG